MNLKIVLKLAVKNLLTKKLRTFVTVGGMSVGVGVIVFLLSFGFGLQHVVTEQLVGLKSIDTITVTSQKSKVLKLDSESMSVLKQFTNVQEVVGLLSAAGKVSYGGSTTDIVIYGTSQRYLELSDVGLTSGEFFQKDFDTNKLEVLVNSVALETIGIKDSIQALGKELDIKVVNNSTSAKEEQKSFKAKIVGVVADNAGSFIYVHEEQVKKLGDETYSQALVLVNDRNSIPTIKEKIESKGFTTSSPFDTLNQINQVFKYLNIFLAGLGTVGLLIAAGGMFNTLTVSLLERTREIALMKILGARSRDIGRLFLAEAVIMTFSGGLLGVVFARVLGFIINTWLGILARQSNADPVALFRVPTFFGLFIILFSVGLGLLTAFYPARRGMKINPLRALKQE